MVSTELLYQHYLSHPVISTDTRNISSGCLFFALKGEHFDANTFALQALEQGAAFAVVDDKSYANQPRCLLVEDVLTSLQDLARHHRFQLSIPVIGLTGSNGKTTSKELINSVLSEKYRTFATKGNLNNHIGVPLSVLSITPEIEIAVIEMGANHQKEIEFLCHIARPTHGVITNVGMAHLEGFGGFEGVKKGKAELYVFLKETGGITFVNKDNPALLEMSASAGLEKIVYYGSDKQNAVSGRLSSSDPYIELEWHQKEVVSAVKTHLTGSYNFENILAAICIGDFFKLSPVEIKTGLESYNPTNNRSQITKTEKNTVICDFYNANPSSIQAALNNLKILHAPLKTAILGDMFELGQESAAQHELIVEKAQHSGADLLIFIGEDFYQFKNRYDGLFFKSPADASYYLKQNPLQNQLILLKGSRGMKLEQLLELL